MTESTTLARDATPNLIIGTIVNLVIAVGLALIVGGICCRRAERLWGIAESQE